MEEREEREEREESEERKERENSLCFHFNAGKFLYCRLLFA